MNINAEIVHAGEPVSKPTRNGGQYRSIDVIFRQDGNSETRTQVVKDFVNEAIFSQVQTLIAGQTYAVVIEKDKNGYWQWTSIGAAGSVSEVPVAAANTTQVAGKPGRVVGNNYETAQERGRRQLFTTRAMAMKVVVESLDKLPSTEKQWIDAYAAGNQIANFVMAGYELNEDDTVKRSQDPSDA